MELKQLGIPTAKINQLQRKNIETAAELMAYLPRTYRNFNEQVAIAPSGEEAVLIGGTISKVTVKGKNLSVEIQDELSEQKGTVSFFGQAYLHKQLAVGDSIYVGGKVTAFYGKSFITPLQWSKDRSDLIGIHPVYSKIKGVSDDYLKGMIQSVISGVSKDDFLEPELIGRFGVIPAFKAMRWLHQPSTMEQIELAKKRHLFNELFAYNFHLLNRTQRPPADVPGKLEHFFQTKDVLDRLPFSLTDGQRSALRGITQEMRSEKWVDALVMGDVGCGKTMVALLLLVGQVENGGQGVLMAPTNVLALQHYREAEQLLAPLGIRLAFLNGSTKVRERKRILKELREGDIDLLIGTHACIGADVVFNKLTIAIVDEEHRFGVRQREGIREKVSGSIHTISMSATPIPRSLATTLYGEHVSIYTIASMPSGRKPVPIQLSEDTVKAYNAIESSLKRGEQAYIVCPLIETNEGEAMKDVVSVEDAYAEALKRFGGLGYQVACISGDMKESDIAEELIAFAENRTQVLVSTTIIEVGVNVPNATTMVIQNAERFGSSQLWQLKGRVGRGEKPSACYLVSPSPNELSKKKLEMICGAKDGFEVAREDLKMRGAGSLLGEQQSGGNRYIQLMLEYGEWNEEIRQTIREILSEERRRKRYQAVLQKRDALSET